MKGSVGSAAPVLILPGAGRSRISGFTQRRLWAAENPSMKNLNRWLVALCAALLVPAVASAAVDMFLQIKSAKGETRVVRCPDGAGVVEGLAAGQYSVLVCDAQGKVIPSDVALTYAIVSPRDPASGQATGKRMHKPITITKELSKGAKPANEIAIDEAGVHLAIGVSAAAVDAAAAKISKPRSNASGY